jgi:hypothetical protein
MDPYLENPLIWSGVRFAILAVIQDQLALIAREHRCFLQFAVRTYTTDGSDPAYPLFIAPPPSRPHARITLLDHEIEDAWLEIHSASPAERITIIEVMTPEYKVPGSYARAAMLESRRSALAENVNWFEIDLLRNGTRVIDPSPGSAAEYCASLSRSGRPKRAYFWPISLRNRLPTIAVPLRDGLPDMPLDLQSVIDRVFLRGGYDLSMRYEADPPPPMSTDNLIWCRDRIREWQSDDPPTD